MSENNSPNKNKLRSLGKFALPALMVLLCVGLYLFTGPLKPKNNVAEAENAAGAETAAKAEPEPEPEKTFGGQRSSEPELRYTHQFFQAAGEAGFTDTCVETATSLRQRDYGISWEGGDASLSLSLEDGCIIAFTFIAAMTPQVEAEPGDSLIRADMLEQKQQKRAMEQAWVLGAADDFLLGLDGKVRLTVADRDAFLLLIESTIIDGKAAETTLSGVKLSAALTHAAELDMLHISASMQEDY